MPIRAATLAALAWLCLRPAAAWPSTYVVYIPLDSSIYDELDELDGLGYLDTYIAEVKPIARVEAARLTIEADRNLELAEHDDPLAQRLLATLHAQLREEIAWLANDGEDDLPTMVHPLERAELQYVFSSGLRRVMNSNTASVIQAREATPLLPDNDDLPTSAGSNEIARASGWAGAFGFLTAYGEGSLAGPITHSPTGTSRERLLRGEMVVGLGNFALSAGYAEMFWGSGHYASLSQGNNAQNFPAVRLQNIHPGYLPGFLRYLGPFRFQMFFGQLDHDRTFSRPWLDGQTIAFKPLPTLEISLTHTIMFGGRGNDHYSLTGFFGRATGFATGSPSAGNTNSRGSVNFKFYLPSLRNTVLYQEILGEDNLTKEVPGIGRFLPFLSRSFLGGVYVPRLTADGLTTARLEFLLTDMNYSTHSDSLFWTYDNRLMADPMGPNASQVNLALGRWIERSYKLEGGPFYTERAPSLGIAGLVKERSAGVSLDVLRMAEAVPALRGTLCDVRLHTAVEYVTHINYLRDQNDMRAVVSLSTSLTPVFDSFAWR